MDTALRWTSADLEVMPDNGKRYEIIDGELYVSRSPNFHHQFACNRITRYLDEWSERTALGIVNSGTGVIFADDDDVIPDVVWISRERARSILDKKGHFHAAPDLAVEVLSPGSANEKRDRQSKLKLYSRRGVLEYWIVNWLMSEITIYRRKGKALRLQETLRYSDTLTSPLLPGFKCTVKSIFDVYIEVGSSADANDSADNNSIH
ncbi:MAG TPA: Uma2 family endonuclease [Blastocatellia bacterium]|nr:Uma2 family endonuclease [Blastocatellia bacterium]HMV84711.1 Uma2 family endonuclease [Blastocatellia bacterium]HMY76204.1 Uma2 family endonuclease [Blastocatellia bacterium]HMZ19422.1 Uma2 family endonuclease [Blastocatellia bacterium]HNG30305.1 Uma2 family endonuclease [Blastocatellia bacterium]